MCAFILAQHYMPVMGHKRGTEYAMLMNRYEAELVRSGRHVLFRRVMIDNVWAEGDPGLLTALATYRPFAQSKTTTIMNIFDISRTLSADLPPWPGDVAFSQKVNGRIAEGSSVNVSSINMSLHNGTHGDAKWHFATMAGRWNRRSSTHISGLASWWISARNTPAVRCRSSGSMTSLLSPQSLRPRRGC
jgi:hypothetical protein